MISAGVFSRTLLNCASATSAWTSRSSSDAMVTMPPDELPLTTEPIGITSPTSVSLRKTVPPKGARTRVFSRVTDAAASRAVTARSSASAAESCARALPRCVRASSAAACVPAPRLSSSASRAARVSASTRSARARSILARAAAMSARTCSSWACASADSSSAISWSGLTRSPSSTNSLASRPAVLGAMVALLRA